MPRGIYDRAEMKKVVTGTAVSKRRGRPPKTQPEQALAGGQNWGVGPIPDLYTYANLINTLTGIRSQAGGGFVDTFLKKIVGRMESDWDSYFAGYDAGKTVKVETPKVSKTKETKTEDSVSVTKSEMLTIPTPVPFIPTPPTSNA